MNHRVRDHNLKVRNLVDTHGQTARDMAWMAELTFKRMGTNVSGLKVAPKVSIIIHRLELGKPYVFPMGSKAVKPSNDTDGRGCDKKRKLACNAWDRDSKFVPTRKRADLSRVHQATESD